MADVEFMCRRTFDDIAACAKGDIAALRMTPDLPPVRMNTSSMYHLSPGLWPAPLQHIGEDPTEAQAPLADGLVADHDPTRRQHQLNITQAHTEAMIEPDGMLDDLGREAEATTGSATSSCRARCHSSARAANLTLPRVQFLARERSVSNK
jgi:hypothetical protein